MEKKSDILSRVDHRSGMTVPDGYFADFAARMEQSLPQRQSLPSLDARPRTLWQRVRPYCYMAAMFAGIWCMLRMFTMMGGGSTDLSIDNYPGVSTALADERFVKDYIVPSVDEYEFYENLYDQEDMTPEEFFDFDAEDVTHDSENELILPAASE